MIVTSVSKCSQSYEILFGLGLLSFIVTFRSEFALLKKEKLPFETDTKQ